ncbi:glutaredoxin 3 [Motiliproteus coralliicola]|uniref:Glutaredoxin n=1 Tax=Motiliproteus coralliicola TaxID=2283196 RepID=A0A369WFU8_9GAMM|nr:glutaredoxin 3 [Motiliproteus coralliicola]RDE18345.1 glutaredoxin 3 [Motiliproteus coralliicola]
MPNITVYSTAYCPYCIRAKMLLEQKGAEFDEIRVDQQPQLRAEMMKRSNGGRTVPQIFIGDTHVGGCDELFALERQGRLDPLLSA